MSRWISSIPEITADLKVKADVATRNGAKRVVDGAKRRSRVDTGRMREGWDYEQTGPAEYTVFNDVDYTIYNEFGTRNMSAQPMLGPATEEERHREAIAKEIAEAFR